MNTAEWWIKYFPVVLGSPAREYLEEYIDRSK